MSSAPFLALGAWLLTYLLHSTALLGSVALLQRFTPRRTARFAETAWRAALLGSVVTATVQLLLAEVELPLIGFGSAASGAAMASSQRGASWLARAGETEMLRYLTPVLVSAVVLWLSIATLRVIALVRAHRAFRGSLAGRTPLDAERAHRVAVWFAAQRLRPSRVSVSANIETPLVLGANEVCLPSRALGAFTSAELDAALAHEVAHLVRRDGRWLTLSALVERMLFVQPLNRVAHERLRALAECACDDWALARTRDPIALASALTHVTSWLVGNPSHALAIGMSSHRVERESLAVARVRRILDPAETRFALHPRGVQRAFAATALAAVVLLVPRVPPGALGVARTAALHSPNTRFTISAHDDAGPFTLTLQGSVVVGATIDGEPVATNRIRQVGTRVVVVGNDGADALDLTVTGAGGISWNSRPAPSISLAR